MAKLTVPILVDMDSIRDYLAQHDIVSVVRCKDCKYRELETIHGKQRYVCQMDSADPYEMSKEADNDEWFCADGEEKE